ncbi:hypothetical protein Tco_0933461, partial [Tanacetum coccineum]
MSPGKTSSPVPLFLVVSGLLHNCAIVGMILASGTLSLIKDVTPQAFFGTTLGGTAAQLVPRGLLHNCAIVGMILASGTLSLIKDVTPQAFFGTTLGGTAAQSFVVEIIITSIRSFSFLVLTKAVKLTSLH